ncbi:MAG: hypothetical protein ABJP70_07745 [Erythrobacter sp.]
MSKIFKSAVLASAMAVTALTGASSALAQPSADTFTFTSQASSNVTVGSDGTGLNPYSGSYLTGTSETAFANGTNTAGNYTCVSMTQPPTDSLFDAHMLCDVTDSQGSYSVTFGCTIIDAATVNWSCIGGLYGKSGAYEGRRGTLTNHTVGDAATGTGQWYR